MTDDRVGAVVPAAPRCAPRRLRDQAGRWGVAVPALLAHQGGWDEILFVAGPIIVIIGLLRLAKHRVTTDRRADNGDAGDANKRAQRADDRPPPGSD